MKDIVSLSRELMLRQTKKNKAPVWKLTEIAARKGKELSKKYHTNEKLVLAALYLAHTVFSPIWKGKIQKNHEFLSARFAKSNLNKWKVKPEEQDIILNAIEAHHGKAKMKSKVAEVMRNAECFKFVTLEGSLIMLQELGVRGYQFDEAIDKTLQKAKEKMKLLTLSDCKKEAKSNYNKILSLLSSLKSS